MIFYKFYKIVSFQGPLEEKILSYHHHNFLEETVVFKMSTLYFQQDPKWFDAKEFLEMRPDVNNRTQLLACFVRLPANINYKNDLHRK